MEKVIDGLCNFVQVESGVSTIRLYMCLNLPLQCISAWQRHSDPSMRAAPSLNSDVAFAGSKGDRVQASELHLIGDD